MADAGWAALGGIAVGVIGKGLWDWWLAAGKVRADREAREEARRDRRAERRDNLQRETLLSAQGAAADLVRYTGKMLADRLDNSNNLSSAYIPPPALSEPYSAASAQFDIAQSRIADPETRDALFAIRIACHKANSAESRSEIVELTRGAAELLSSFQDRAGQLIREMDASP